MSSRPCTPKRTIASLAGSHNKSDARDTGMDAQQLVEFVVDDAPTVVQLLAQVFLHFYRRLFLHMYRRDYYSLFWRPRCVCCDIDVHMQDGDLLLRHCSQYYHAQDRRQRIRDTSNVIKMCTRHL